MFLDLHSHVLPGVDDGAADLREALSLLRALKLQGVKTVVATPHLDPTASSGAREKILAAYNGLIRELDGSYPELLLGFEVKYFSGMSRFSEIKNYTVESSNVLLLELPFCNIEDKMIDDILEMSYNFNIKVILAHLERYADFKGFDKLLACIDEGSLWAQVSTDCVLHRRYRNHAKRLIGMRMISFVGSDAHSMSSRPPCFDEFFEFTDKKFGKGFKEFIFENSASLYESIKKVTA